MVTRRTLLKQGIYATVSATTAAILAPRVSAQSAGFDFYISPSGSDSNPGTRDRPWAITALNTHRGDYAGKRVGLLDGTYNVFSLCESTPNGGIALSINGGSASTPTVVAAVNARKAILTGGDPSTGAYPSKSTAYGMIGQGYGQAANKGNVILDGLYITRGFGAAIGFFPQLPPTSGIVIRNCEIFDIGGIENYNPAGIRLKACSGTLIQNNRIHSVQMAPGHNAAGILTFNCRSNVYEYNTIYDCNSGIYDKNDHNGNHTYRYNYVEIAGAYPAAAMTDCAGGDAGEVATVHNNIFIAPAAWDGSTIVLPSKQSVVFYNNTCYCQGSVGGVFYPAGGPLVSPPATVTLYNNVIYAQGNGGWQGVVRFPAGSVVLSNYNLFRVAETTGTLFGFSQPANARAVPKLYTLNQWQKATGFDGNSVASAIPSGSMFAAHNKLDPASYSLQPSSVGRNLGRVGGTAAGAVTDAGAWGGGPARIGCDFGPSPGPPVLSVS